jgi:hypothetical protein
MARADAGHFAADFRWTMKTTYKVSIVATGIVIAYALYVQIYPIIRTRIEQAELRHLSESLFQERSSKLEKPLRCSVPARRSAHVNESFGPTPSLWIQLSATPKELSTMRQEIDPAGWLPAFPDVQIPIPSDSTRPWNPPTSNVWSRSEVRGETVQVWITTDNEEKMYYCQFIKPQESKEPNQTSEGLRRPADGSPKPSR